LNESIAGFSDIRNHGVPSKWFLKVRIVSMVIERWLIIGGAGYIGAHIADLFLSNNKEVFIVDSLIGGSTNRISYLRKIHGTSLTFIQADIRDKQKMREIVTKVLPTGVILTAALKSVDESFKKSDEYFEVNHHAVSDLIEIVSENNIKKLFFSSSAAVYGSPQKETSVRERDTTKPISPYGQSKLLAECLVQSYLELPENNGTCFRYFNVVGTRIKELADNSMSNLIPIVFNKIRNQEDIKIFGKNYQTKDGTCVRDYIDVRDIARAHLISANCDSKLPYVMNLGSERGVTVLEIVSEICRVMKIDLEVEFCDPREGDPPQLVSNSELISKELGFSCEYTITDSIESLLR
jgi:UDP-glucose 4-epimerase